MTEQHLTAPSLLTDALEAVGRALPAAMFVCGVVTGMLGILPLAALGIAAGVTLFVYPHLEPMEPPEFDDTSAQDAAGKPGTWTGPMSHCNG
ncbi:MAG: hypothetical protein AAFR47_18465 [Pseudomonadota bacterium]